MVKRHITWLFVITNVLIDSVLIVIGFDLAWWVRYIAGVGGSVGRPDFVALESYGGMRLGLLSIILAVFAVSGVYRMPRGRTFWVEVTQIIHAILTSLGLLVVALFLGRIPYSSRLLLGYSGVVVTLLLLAARFVERLVKQAFWKRGIGVVRVLVVGDGMAARDVMRDLIINQRNGRQLWGCLALDPQRTGDALLVDAGQATIVPVYGSVDDLDTIMVERDIRQVVIALPGAETELTQRAVRTCIRRGVDFRLAPELYGIAAQTVRVDDTYSRPVLTVHNQAIKRSGQAVKRIFDIVFSLLLLIPFGLLIMLVAAILIKLDSRGPIFFRQQRLTNNGSIFWVYKFRTMRVTAEQERAQLEAMNEASGPIFKMRNDPRLTRVGKWLRRTSLDELPQVFNILLGEMSWVGPRPPLPAEVSMYEDWQKRRLGTLTGVTGLWQVSGRSLLSFEEMVKLDLYYVENWSLWLDLRILVQTIPAVLTGRGAF